MHVVETKGMMSPGVCFICEESPLGGPVVDTLKEHSTPWATNLTGRKYVCARCVGQFAQLLGYELTAHLDEVDAELWTYNQQVAEFDHNLRESLNNLTLTMPKPPVIPSRRTANFDDVREEDVSTGYMDPMDVLAPATTIEADPVKRGRGRPRKDAQTA